VARKIEKAGIPTVTVNLIWEFQRALGMPRVAAVEHPFGRPYGEVADRATQTAVLRAALDVFASAKQPGHVAHLDFIWHQEPRQTRWHPQEPAPIIRFMKEQGRI
tara:strand:- start:842 stop:1156 length:315 start_codon:yes stop_codon:yes gene_type:complete